jgi:hypothetical protein
MNSPTSKSYFPIIVPIIFQGHTHSVPHVNSPEYLVGAIRDSIYLELNHFWTGSQLFFYNIVNLLKKLRRIEDKALNKYSFYITNSVTTNMPGNAAKNKKL